MVLILLVYFMAGLRYTAGAFFGNLFTVYLVMLVRPLDRPCKGGIKHQQLYAGAANLAVPF